MATLVTIEVFFSQPEALVAKSYLNAYGIPVICPNWHHTSNAWHLTFALQGIPLLAMDCDAETAQALLNAEDLSPLTPTCFSIVDAVLAGVLFCGSIGIPHPVRRLKGLD